MSAEAKPHAVLIRRLGPSNTIFRLTMDNAAGDPNDPDYILAVSNVNRWKFDDKKRFMGVIIEDPERPATIEGLQRGHMVHDLQASRTKVEEQLDILSKPHKRIPFRIRQFIKDTPSNWESLKLRFWLTVGYAIHYKELEAERKKHHQ